MTVGLGGVLAMIGALSATAVVEGPGAYPPIDVLHNFVYVNGLAVVALLLGFLFVAAVGVGRLAKRTAAEA